MWILSIVSENVFSGSNSSHSVSTLVLEQHELPHGNNRPSPFNAGRVEVTPSEQTPNRSLQTLGEIQASFISLKEESRKH